MKNNKLLLSLLAIAMTTAWFAGASQSSVSVKTSSGSENKDIKSSDAQGAVIELKQKADSSFCEGNFDKAQLWYELLAKSEDSEYLKHAFIRLMRIHVAKDKTTKALEYYECALSLQAEDDVPSFDLELFENNQQRQQQQAVALTATVAQNDNDDENTH